MRSRADAAPAYLYVPDLPDSGAGFGLSPEDSHYVTRVCRARAGDRLTATDGAGRVAGIQVLELGRQVRAVVRDVARRPPPADVAVWCGPPEGTRADWLVEKLAELGVRAWQSLDCARGAWEAAHGRRDRWRRLAIAALRQSRRSHLMAIAEPIPVTEALGRLGTAPGERWIGSERGPRGARPMTGAAQVGTLGPARGFDAGEAEAFDRAGFQPISLSDGRLRTETAALAFAIWASTG